MADLVIRCGTLSDVFAIMALEQGSIEHPWESKAIESLITDDNKTKVLNSAILYTHLTGRTTIKYIHIAATYTELTIRLRMVMPLNHINQFIKGGISNTEPLTKKVTILGTIHIVGE
jgi:hypothetical protein